MRPADDQAAVYHRWQFWLSCASLLVTILYLAWIVVGVQADPSRHLRPTPLWWRDVALYAVILGAGLKLLTSPLDWVRGYWLPTRFGLLHQSFVAWCWDRLKAAAIGGALTLMALEIIYGSLRLSAWWWLWAALVLFAGSLLLTVVVPVWIVPLFYRLVPLKDAALKERLLELTKRVGVAVVGVWVADQSRKSRTANAALTGLGRTRRILLFDTLIAEFTPEEIESVLAHELGHHVHGDLMRGLLVQGTALLATFWAADYLLRLGSARFGYQGPADPWGLPLLALILLLLGLIRRLRPHDHPKPGGVHQRHGAAREAEPRRAPPKPPEGVRPLLPSLHRAPHRDGSTFPLPPHPTRPDHKSRVPDKVARLRSHLA
ncbi:MAG: M48 family metalloprotease [Candidatus Rokubacteria bacterium]|nr:M48 family metalloprotease [Candidatus Rokubacteria bacterium]